MTKKIITDLSGDGAPITELLDVSLFPNGPEYSRAIAEKRMQIALSDIDHYNKILAAGGPDQNDELVSEKGLDVFDSWQQQCYDGIRYKSRIADIYREATRLMECSLQNAVSECSENPGGKAPYSVSEISDIERACGLSLSDELAEIASSVGDVSVRSLDIAISRIPELTANLRKRAALPSNTYVLSVLIDEKSRYLAFVSDDSGVVWRLSYDVRYGKGEWQAPLMYGSVKDLIIWRRTNKEHFGDEYFA